MATARFRLLTAAALLVLAWPCRAIAHPVGVSQGDYVLAGHRVYAGVTFAQSELVQALPWLRGEGGARLVALEQNRERLGRWLLERLIVSQVGASCQGAFDGLRFEGDGVALALSYECPHPTANVVLDARFVSELDRAHRHLASLSSDDERREKIATRDRTVLSFDEADEARALFAPLVRMGIEHILTGYDHLLFLLGLVLIGGPIRSLVYAITSFTLAHSITLALSCFGIWTPSSRIVEPLIALSIAYVGIENWFARDARGRWRITFAFGLVHGFGFAGALREIALARSEIPTALFAFNLGVEIGQVAVLAILFPLVYLAHKKDMWDRVGMRACTAAIALSGVVWFVVRLRGAV